MNLYCKPEDTGLDIERLKRTYEVLGRRVLDGAILGGSIQVGCLQGFLEPRFFGRRSVEDPSALVASDTIFLFASLIKPVVATGVMLLVGRGEFSWDDTVQGIIPEFQGDTSVLSIINRIPVSNF
jgi:Beta-lactamase